MFREEGGRPGDQHGFLHKSFIGKAFGGIVKRVIPVAGFASDVVSTVKSLARPTISRTTTARPTLAGAQSKELGRQLKLGTDLSVPRLTGPSLADAQPRSIVRTRRSLVSPTVQLHDPDPCMPPLMRSPAGNCIAPTSPRGAELFMGEATMGRYGAAVIPGSQIIDRAVCLAGMQLGKDGLCYNKAAITNSQRMWPRGRRPLLTGGDMRAISIAARAGSKLERTTKRLRSLGMMKALPKGRGVRAHAHAKPVAAVSV